jgi:hypothetical protein
MKPASGYSDCGLCGGILLALDIKVTRAVTLGDELALAQ